MDQVPRWSAAWSDALYGSAGFYRRESPAQHFRTSVHASPLFAEAILAYVRQHGLERVVDLASGRGELLTRLRDLSEPDELALVGVEVADRPHDLPADIGWRPDLPESVDGLLIANEWLDNVPCDVVERDQDGSARFVHVDVTTGDETLGETCDDPWLGRWWPLGNDGERAELGSARDAAWSDAVARLRSGHAIAIDYGHLREARPPYGSLQSFRGGRQVDVRLDGSRDVTAHVAVDAVAASCGGRLVRQRDALADLGVTGGRPPLDLATSDPQRYLAALSRSAEAAELTATGGLGDFWWVICER